MTPNVDKVLEAFDNLWNTQGKNPWLLSVIYSPKSEETDFLSLLVETRCQLIPYSLLSLALYVNQLGDLFSAILESPSIRVLIPENVIKSYGNNNTTALMDLSRISIVMPRQEMKESPEGQQTMDADVDEVVRTMETHMERRVSYSWLSAISSLDNQTKLVFLFDDYDAFVEEETSQTTQLFFSVLERAHMLVPGLRVVITSYIALHVPKIWQDRGFAKAYRL